MFDQNFWLLKELECIFTFDQHLHYRESLGNWGFVVDKVSVDECSTAQNCHVVFSENRIRKLYFCAVLERIDALHYLEFIYTSYLICLVVSSICSH